MTDWTIRRADVVDWADRYDALAAAGAVRAAAPPGALRRQREREPGATLAGSASR